MKNYAAIPPSRPRHIRVPAFLPVPLRTRADGWTPLRQAVFLVALAASRSVSAAARKAEMSRESAYRLRRRAGAESFAAIWDLVLGRGGKPKVTPEVRMLRAMGGLVRPVVWRGTCSGVTQKFDNSALLGLLAQLDRGAGAMLADPEKSQSFGADPASSRQARRSTDRPQGTPGRTRTGGLFRACRGAGPRGGIRR